MFEPSEVILIKIPRYLQQLIGLRITLPSLNLVNGDCVFTWQHCSGQRFACCDRFIRATAKCFARLSHRRGVRLSVCPSHSAIVLKRR